MKVRDFVPTIYYVQPTKIFNTEVNSNGAGRPQEIVDGEGCKSDSGRQMAIKQRITLKCKAGWTLASGDKRKMNPNELALAGCLTLGLFTTALAQGAPTGKPIVQVKPKAIMGCKLVGTVKGTKIWSGDCVEIIEIRGTTPEAATPSTLPERAAGAIPPGQKQ